MPQPNQIITDSADAMKASQDKPFYAALVNQQQDLTMSSAVSDSLLNGALRALPHEFKTDVQVLSDFRLGTFLRRHGNINGDLASIVDGVIDFIRKDPSEQTKKIITNFTYAKKFIPIVLVTEFNLDSDESGNKKPFYVIFDSTPEDGFSYKKAAQYQSKAILGRPEPIQIYETSSAVSFSLKGKFFSDSPEEHVFKLGIGNKLFALVSPTRNHFLPSPVEVRIGSWKTLRCIVTNVNVDYKGPWWVGGRAADLPLHAPYLFEVTFDFTVVSEKNQAQYAEDIIQSGYNDGITSKSDLNVDAELRKSIEAKASGAVDPNGNEIFSAYFNDINDMVANKGIIETKFQVQRSVGSNIDYLKSLGLPVDSNSSTKLAGLAEITSGLTATTQTAITNTFGPKIAKALGK